MQAQLRRASSGRRLLGVRLRGAPQSALLEDLDQVVGAAQDMLLHQRPGLARIMLAQGLHQLRVLTSGGRVVRVVALHIESSVRAVDMTDSPDELSRWSVAQVE